MTTNYILDKTKSGTNGFGIQFSDTIYSATLKAATEATVSVPATAAIGAPTATSNNKFYAIFSSDDAADVFIALNGTAAVPVGTTFAATTSELLPRNQYCAKLVKTGDVIHVISPGTPSISISFYAVQE